MIKSLLEPDYKEKIDHVFAGIKNRPAYIYKEYLYYEELWRNYFEEIFLKYNNLKEKPIVRLIIMESCPEGIFPHPNYLFDNLKQNLDPIRHRYLDQIVKGFSIPNYPVITKEKALIELAKLNVLILDILPCHGMKLDSKISRKNINKMPNDCCDFNKIKQLEIELNQRYHDLKYHIVYSMPPSIDFTAINSKIGIKNTLLGSMTTTSGFPSFNALLTIIQHENNLTHKTITVYHATNNYLLDSIISYGLGGRNIIHEWNVIELAKIVFEKLKSIDEVNDQFWYGTFNLVVANKLSNSVDLPLWRHGSVTFVTYSKLKAIKTANVMPEGEFLHYLKKGIEFINSFNSTFINEIKSNYEQICNYLFSDLKPIVIEFNIELELLLTEFGTELIMEDWEEIFKHFDKAITEFMSFDTNFQLKETFHFKDYNILSLH